MTRFALRRSLLLMLVIALCGTVQGFAGNITFTCDSVSFAIHAPGGACNYLNSTIAGLYGSTFSNANANIYIGYANIGSAVGESAQILDTVPYSQYFTQLSAESTDAVALASLPATEPAIFNNGDIAITAALAQALGISDPGGGVTAGLLSCTVGNPGCYNGVILISSSQPLWYRSLSGGGEGSDYDFLTVVEHETDEILGTISCIATTSGLFDQCGGTNQNQNNNAAAVDLFRYSAAGARDFGDLASAYFSPNGGITDTDGNQYNHFANNEDYADFSSSCTFVQDATGCPGGSFDITTDGPGHTKGPEVAILNAVGYDLAPEPGSLVLLGTGMLGLAARMRRKKN